MQRHILWVVLGLGLALIGCDDSTGDQKKPDTNTQPDTGSVDANDAGGGTDTNPGSDTNGGVDTNQPPSGAAGGLGLTNGGGQAETSRYKLTLSIGGPLVSTTMSSTNYKLTIGVGAARPAQ